MTLIRALWWRPLPDEAASPAPSWLPAHAPPGRDDEVLLVVDGPADLGGLGAAGAGSIEGAAAQGFAACANAALGRAAERGSGVLLADAAAVPRPAWTEPAWTEAGDHGPAVLALSARRPLGASRGEVCALHLSAAAQAALGRFDEGFRSPRAAIEDLRLRALARGVQVVETQAPGDPPAPGRSAWAVDRPPPRADVERFAQRWGEALCALFLTADDLRGAARGLGVEALAAGGDWAEIVRRYAPPGPDDRRWVRPLERRLCLHMVVADAGPALEGCLRSVAGHLAHWIVGDAGSTDGTPERIERFFAGRGIPGELHPLSSRTAVEARDEALARARRSPLPYDYLLLMDPGLALAVEDRSFNRGLDAPAYRLRGPDGAWTPRLIGRDTFGGYRRDDPGVFEVRSVAVRSLAGARLVRGEDGAGRDPAADAARDRAADRRTLDAAARVAERFGRIARGEAGRDPAAAGDEEDWRGLMRGAREARAAGRGGEALAAAADAFALRPERADPLRLAADHLRLRGLDDAAAEVALAGLRLVAQAPGAEGEVADGLREDLAHAAHASAARPRRAEGLRACDALSRSRGAAPERRETARRNLFFYAERLAEMVDGAALSRLEPPLDDGWRAMNPSVALWKGELWACIRLVNYRLRDSYYTAPAGGPFVTRNLLARLDGTLRLASLSEVLAPVDQPAPLSRVALGFEDLRLIPIGDELWSSSSVREMNAEGWCEQVLARIEGAGGAGPCRLAAVSPMPTGGPPRHEKNWTAQVTGSDLRFIHSYEGEVLVSRTGAVLRRGGGDAAHDHLRGGSHALPFRGGWLAVCHEVVFIGIRRCYLHRFAWFDADTRLARLGDPFRFGASDVEFVAGLAPHPDGARLVISYGVADAEAWLAAVPIAEVERLLGFGGPPAA